jgi:hypothetical protein
MVAGSDYTLPYAIVCGYDSKEILNQTRAHSGFSVGKDYWRSRSKAGLRRCKEAKGAEKRHLLVDTEGLWC